MLEIKGFLDGLRPVPKLTVSEWADQNRYLSPVAAAEPGQWRTNRAPYLREPMDMLSAHSPVQTVVCMKGAQLGWTEAGNNWIGYVIDISPAPMLMVMPTEDGAKKNSKTRIDTMVEASPALRKRIRPARSRDSENTTLSKKFAGGILLMVGANSAAGMRSLPIRFLFLDEVDAYPHDLDGEGSPVELAEARTRTFANRKIFKISTPTIAGASLIESEFRATDQRYYHVPCPDCGHKQHLKFENLKWTEGKPETALYHCEGCGVGIPERKKPWLLNNGEWIATAPENANPTKVGYHLNSLYSPLGWFSWAQIAEKYETAIKEKSNEKLKAFYNTILGLPYEEPGEAPEWEAIYNKRENYQTNRPPKDVVFVTAGVDVQKDRIELELVGWCRNKISYSIDYRLLMGDTTKTEVWDKLADVVNETWTREDGAILTMRMMAVDTGYNTEFVYNFCRRFDSSRVIPVKGQSQQNVIISSPKLVDTLRSGKKIKGMAIWNIGVNIIKGETYGLLRLQKITGEETPHGYCHFPATYDMNYFRGLTAEQMIRTVKNGYTRFDWIKKFERNEPLDCRVYARAAAEYLGISRLTEQDWELVEAQYNRIDTPQDRQPRKGDDRSNNDGQQERRKSKFWSR